MFTDSFKNLKGSYSQKVNRALSEFRDRLPGDSRDYYDYTPVRFKKRRDTAIEEIGRVKEHLKGVCEDSLIEADFAFSNGLIMSGGYNYDIDCNNATTLSAAIWILDQLSLQGRLKEIFPYLPSEAKYSTDEFFFLPVNHPMYDFELIMQMVQLIRYRNTSNGLLYGNIGALQWDPGEADSNEESKKNRASYDAVIKLLDPEAIEKAVSQYETDVWRFYRLSFRASSLLEKHIDKLEHELAELNKDIPAIVFGNEKHKVLSLFTQTNDDELRKDALLDEKKRIRIEVLNRELDRLHGITFTQLSLVNDREKTVRKLGKILPDELGRELAQFHVEDPFESAFALLYLLDTGSSIPWLYYGSISVAYTMYDQFPYDSQISAPTKPVRISEWNSALYEHKYSGYRWPDRTDASREPVQRKLANNLSQLLYSNTMALFPRVIPEVKSLDSFLESLGELSPQEREAYALLLYSLQAEALRAASYDTYQLELKIKEELSEDETQDTKDEPEDSVDSLAERIEQLRKKNQDLLSLLQDNLQQKRQISRQFELLSETVEKQRKELADLREKAFLLEQKEIVEEKEDQTIQYPYRVDRKIISFGGYSSWITEMKKRLPDVVFISPDTLPNTDIIRGADEVWIQTNCISHSSYYKIMGVLREMDKQVRYFIYSGVGKCSEQMVKAFKERT